WLGMKRWTPAGARESQYDATTFHSPTGSSVVVICAMPASRAACPIENHAESLKARKSTWPAGAIVEFRAVTWVVKVSGAKRVDGLAEDSMVVEVMSACTRRSAEPSLSRYCA